MDSAESEALRLLNVAADEPVRPFLCEEAREALTQADHTPELVRS